MKASIRVRQLQFEVEGDKMTDVFQQFASLQEVFGEPCCALCGCEDLQMVCREVTSGEGKKAQTHTYHELRCNNPKCRGNLAFGVRNDNTGSLFPKRKLAADGCPPGKDEEGRHGRHRGWHRYDFKNRRHLPLVDLLIAAFGNVLPGEVDEKTFRELKQEGQGQKKNSNQKHRQEEVEEVDEQSKDIPF